MPEQKTSPSQSSTQTDLAGIRNIIAIASGKGGVGKSTIATNLAVALRRSGASVGLMDADIYGPSQPGMLGSGQEKPSFLNGRIQPISKHGVSFISMGLLVPDDTPTIWRGPMATKMIQQFIGGVLWGELDYLLIDLPPGTGDVQLTLAQKASLTGAIIVTTPQRVAFAVARKGLKMFEQVNVPILGIVENMSGFTCKHCGKLTAIFNQGGGQQMARELGVPYLGSIPLDQDLMTSSEDGVPLLTGATDTPAAQALLSFADEVKKSVEKLSGAIRQDEPQDIELSAEGDLLVRWPDGHPGMHTPYHLRVNCGCALCMDEDSGRRLLDASKVPLDIKIREFNRVGRYGLAISFSDGHDTGIYRFEILRELCECDTCKKGGPQEPGSFSV